jgi:hypothetical protein
VAYSSTKGYIGHTISAAGAINAIFTLAMLRGGWIAPCINAEPLDPELEDYPQSYGRRRGNSAARSPTRSGLAGRTWRSSWRTRSMASSVREHDRIGEPLAISTELVANICHVVVEGLLARGPSVGPL